MTNAEPPEVAGPASSVRSDEAELRALSTAYAAAADACDGPGLAALFVEDGQLLVPDYPNDLRPVVRRVGQDALRRVPDMLRRYEHTFHLVSNQRYTFDHDTGSTTGVTTEPTTGVTTVPTTGVTTEPTTGDRASGDVQCVAHHLSARPDGGPDGPPAGEGAGTDTVWFVRYHDDYARTSVGWRFIRRTLHLQWVEEHQVSVLADARVEPVEEQRWIRRRPPTEGAGQ